MNFRFTPAISDGFGGNRHWTEDERNIGSDGNRHFSDPLHSAQARQASSTRNALVLHPVKCPQAGELESCCSGGGPLVRSRLTVSLPVVVALAACEPTAAPGESTAAPVEPSTKTSGSSVASGSPSVPFEWPEEHEDSPDLSFPSAADAVEFLTGQMDVDIALPTWVPSSVDLDTGASVFVATREGHRTAQLHLTTKRGEAWGIQYGVSGLDGCAPEESRPVKVSGQPARLRVVADPEGSSRVWTQLIWPATLKRPVGVYGLFGWLSPRAVLAMADSMPQVASRPISALLNC